nr:hypothetical protein [Tobacco rattle virus]
MPTIYLVENEDSRERKEVTTEVMNLDGKEIRLYFHFLDKPSTVNVDLYLDYKEVESVGRFSWKKMYNLEHANTPRFKSDGLSDDTAMSLNFGLKHLEQGVESAGYSISSKVRSGFSFLFDLPESIYKKSFLGRDGVIFYIGHLDMDLQLRNLSGKTLLSDTLFEYNVDRDFVESLRDEHNNEVGKVKIQSKRYGEFLSVRMDWSEIQRVAALRVNCIAFTAKFSSDLSELLPSRAESTAVSARTARGTQPFESDAQYKVGDGVLFFTHKHFVVQPNETWMLVGIPLVKAQGSVFGGAISVIYYLADAISPVVNDRSLPQISKCYLEPMGRRRLRFSWPSKMTNGGLVSVRRRDDLDDTVYELVWENSRFAGVILSPDFGNIVERVDGNTLLFKSDFRHSVNFSDPVLTLIPDRYFAVEATEEYLARTNKRIFLGYIRERFAYGSYNLADMAFKNVNLKFQGDTIELFNNTSCDIELNYGGFMRFLEKSGKYHFGDWEWPSRISVGDVGVYLVPKGAAILDDGRYLGV